MQLLDFLAEGSLDRIGVDEALDFLLAEQKLVLNQRLHVFIALNHGLQ